MPDHKILIDSRDSDIGGISGGVGRHRTFTTKGLDPYPEYNFGLRYLGPIDVNDRSLAIDPGTVVPLNYASAKDFRGKSTGPPMPQTLSHAQSVSIARRATFWAMSGIASYGVLMWFAAEHLGFPRGPMVALFTVIVAINLALALTAGRWAGRRAIGYLYGVTHQVLMTVVMYLVGGTAASFLLFVYLFTIFHTAMIGSASAAFVAANAGAASFGVMALLEMNGWITSPGSLRWQISGAQVGAMVAISWGGLNFFAFYAYRYGRDLRSSANRLAREVAKKTSALTRANTELARRAREVEASEQELRSLVYAVTHDVKNPVNSIMLISDLLRERHGATLSPEAHEELERIAYLAESTEDMIRDMFELFQIQAMKEEPEWFELEPMVSEVLTTLKPQLDNKHLRVSVGPLPRVWGQPRKIGHLLANLLTNAAKYTPDGGAVTVRAQTEDEHVHLSVADDGIGIPPGYHEGIFELFARVPADVQGTDGTAQPGSGVGLAIVKRVIDAHGGRVWVESDVTSETSRGATFHVTLPLPHGNLT